jgi:VWFA-related protein
VTDAKGQAVLGLGRQDFKIFEDGNERPVAFFNVSKKEDLTRPLAVVFAMDVSGSMTEGEMARVRDAMTAFADGLGERPSAFSVMSFGMHVRVLQKFTPDREKLYRAFDLASREKEGLSTHAYDAVDDAIRLLVRKAPRVRDGRLVKKAVILITDGFPVGDTVEPKTVIERAVDAGVSVYSVTLPSYTSSVLTDDRVPLPTPLDVSDLVEKTGGCNVYAWGTNYQDLFRRLAEDVTSSYVLAFYPPEANRVDGRYHSIRVGGPVGVTLRQSRNGYTSKER